MRDLLGSRYGQFWGTKEKSLEKIIIVVTNFIKCHVYDVTKVIDFFFFFEKKAKVAYLFNN